MTCEHCDSECRHRAITLELGAGAGARMVFFCSDSCESKWTRKDHARLRRWLHRIYTTARGRARKAAQLALTTAEQP